MIVLLLVIHVLIAIALVGVVLLQKSEGGALGMGGGGMSGFMTGRSTANFLTRATALLAAVFFATSILLVVLNNRARAPHSIMDQGGNPAIPAGPAPPPAPGAPAAPNSPGMPAAPHPAAPATPAGPSAPLAK
jgi:preprotein translocase subunit SecG